MFLTLLVVLVLRPPPPGSRHDDAPPWARPLVHRDLADIRRDTLRVLVVPDPLTWEEHPGAVSGLEWELLERFARQQGLVMRAVPVERPDSMLRMLQHGDGDIIAAQWCPQGPQRDRVAFSAPYRSVAPIRALRTTWGSRRGRSQPSSDTLWISWWSPFLDVRDAIDTAAHAVLRTDSTTPEDLLAHLALGMRDGAVLTDATAAQEIRRLPSVQFGARIGRSVPLAFAVRTNSPVLLRALNEHLRGAGEHDAIEALIAAYGNAAGQKGPGHLPALVVGTDSISPYDSLFRANADSSAFDWTLFAAVAYRESRFDTAVVSKAGAGGLMQIMPATAMSLGVDTSDGLGGHIRGATGYLAQLDTIWRGSVPDKDQRLKFVLASYNAGPGHIKDAQRLAGLFGLDTHRWDGSVERALLLLSKPRYFLRPEVRNGYCRAQETFWYVRDVVATFARFKAMHATG